MTRYTDFAADQYMRSVLTEELSIDEADNALTALTTLTSTYPRLFPFERTFARPDHQRGVDGAAGVRFIVYGEDGEERFLRLPRKALGSLRDSINEVFEVLRGIIRAT